MQIYRSIDTIPFDPSTVITIGTFDGVHLGHQAMIRALIKTSKRIQARHVLITFDPHPLNVIGKGVKNLLLLTNTDEKLSVFEANQLEHVVLMPFTKIMSKMTAETFIQQILKQKIGLTGLVVGFNHSLGYNRTGTAENLSKIGERYNFFLETVAPVTVDDKIVSSTEIRKSLQKGDVGLAAKWLGRPYTISGQVVPGMKIGRTLGFPTANIKIPDEKIVPFDGIYAVLIFINGQKFIGLANIGYSPTIPGKEWGIEIYIDNFTEIIYNKEIEIHFIMRIRDEMKFNTLEELTQQIKTDKIDAQKILAQYIRR